MSAPDKPRPKVDLDATVEHLVHLPAGRDAARPHRARWTAALDDHELLRLVGIDVDTEILTAVASL